MTNMNPTQWQVVLVVDEGYETWEHPLESEVFDIEQAADQRSDELDQSWHYPNGYLTTCEV